MEKREILESFVHSEDRERFERGHITFYEKIEFICPLCKKQYTSTYGNRFLKGGTLKGTLMCRSCSSSKNKMQRKDPDVGDRFGSLTYKGSAEPFISSSGKKYIQYTCVCDCGQEIVVRKDHLFSGSTTHCKKCKTEILKKTSLNRGNSSDPPIGTVFGQLTFLEKVYRKGDNGATLQMYRCKCACGNEVEVLKNSLLKGATKSCGCLGSRNKLRDKRIEIGGKTDPFIGQKFGKLTVLKIIPPPIGGEKKIECQCDCGNIITINKQSLIRGNYKTCGNCPNIYPQWFIDRLVNEEDRKSAISGILSTQDNVLITCAECGEPTYIRPHNILNLKDHIQKRVGLCNECSHHTSSEELEIREFLLSLGIREEEIIQNKLGIIPNRELDFYLPSYKLAIEFNGSYYHSEDRKTKNYHQDKFKLCEQRGIHLISIFEKDWVEKNDIIKSILISKIEPTTKMYARDLKIIRVVYDKAKEFFDTYHIQGNSQHGNIIYGLVDSENKILSMMSFGRKRYSSVIGEYEIHRYCTLPSLTIVGGASKLLTHFEREYKPKEIMTYSDNDYFTGYVYSQLGFVFEKYTDPDYYWYKSNISIPRGKTQLSILQDKYPDLYKEALDNKASNKEDFIMESLGAIKVYRSGSKRWVKKYV